MIIDIDYFKLFNDRYGHGAGDACLKQVAQVLESCADRGSDLVARYGGEEFVSVLAGTDQKGALIVAEEMRKMVMDLSIPHEDSIAATVVTISIGVSTTRVDGRNSPDEFFNLADRLLYDAKTQGRNRVISSD